MTELRCKPNYLDAEPVPVSPHRAAHNNKSSAFSRAFYKVKRVSKAWERLLHRIYNEISERYYSISKEAGDWTKWS